MVEAALRTVPVPAEPAFYVGVEIGLGAPLERRSLRARDAGTLSRLLGRSVPDRIGRCSDGVLCLGPDEWLLRAPAGTDVPDGAGEPLAVVDVSERAITLVLEGARAIEVLSAGCPRDLSRLGVGEGRRTVFEGVEIVLLRTAEDRFEVDVWRSFAPWLHLALVTAASHLR